MEQKTWCKNLLFLRKKSGATQLQVATALDLTRSTYAKYEEGVHIPNIEVAWNICKNFNIDLLDFMYHDLSDVRNAKKTITLKNAKYVRENVRNDVRSSADNLSHKGSKKSNIIKAFADADEYKKSWGFVYDIHYNNVAGLILFLIKNNETHASSYANIRLPELGNGIHFRLKIDGDNMQPIIKSGDKVVTTYLPEPATQLREGNIYVLIDKDNVISCNRVYKADKNHYELLNDNKIYKPFKLSLKDIQAVFKVVEVHSRSLGTANTETAP